MKFTHVCIICHVNVEGALKVWRNYTYFWLPLYFGCIFFTVPIIAQWYFVIILNFFYSNLIQLYSVLFISCSITKTKGMVVYKTVTLSIWQNCGRSPKITVRLLKLDVLFIYKIGYFPHPLLGFLLHTESRNSVILGRELHLFTVAQKERETCSCHCQNQVHCQAFRALDDAAWTAVMHDSFFQLFWTRDHDRLPFYWHWT